MEIPAPPVQKKPLGPLAWVGIGCGGIVILGIIAFIVVSVMFGGKFKKMATDAQANPTRFTATTMVSVGAGEFEMVAEDDANKRYTVREKTSGKLTTIYWDEKNQAPATVEGDFSAIPASPGPADEPTPVPAPAPEPEPAPAPVPQ